MSVFLLHRNQCCNQKS